MKREVESQTNTNNRALFEVCIEARHHMTQDEVKLKYRFVNDVRDGYAELIFQPSFIILLHTHLDQTASEELRRQAKLEYYKISNHKDRYKQYLDELNVSKTPITIGSSDLINIEMKE